MAVVRRTSPVVPPGAIVVLQDSKLIDSTDYLRRRFYDTCIFIDFVIHINGVTEQHTSTDMVSIASTDEGKLHQNSIVSGICRCTLPIQPHSLHQPGGFVPTSTSALILITVCFQHARHADQNFRN